MFKTLAFLFLIVSCSSQKNDKYLSGSPQRTLTESEKARLITPTIYYVPKFSEFDHLDCPADQRMDLITAQKNLIVKSCREVYKSCQMQGTCQVEVGHEKFLINVDRVIGGVRTFKRVENRHCVFGLGSAQDSVKGYRNMCIDPYFSVAADLSIYNLGDVIFIPLLKGLSLPDGQFHTGYMIVRDSGQAIKGRGRFDFFTGYLGLTRANPFYKLGLSGDGIFPDYFVINGPEADQIRRERNFPLLVRARTAPAARLVARGARSEINVR